MKLADTLHQFHSNIKSLNLSYNQLRGGQDFTVIVEDELDADQKDTVLKLNETNEFLKFLTKFVRKSYTLNHLDLSGLQLMNLHIIDKQDSYFYKSPRNDVHVQIDEEESAGKRARRDKFERLATVGSKRFKLTRILKQQTSQEWINLIELLTACQESTIMLGLHLSDNGFTTFAERVKMTSLCANVP